MDRRKIVFASTAVGTALLVDMLSGWHRPPPRPAPKPTPTTAPAGPVAPPTAKFGVQFIQPGTGSTGPGTAPGNLSWDTARWTTEFTQMKAVDITTVVLQWSVYEDGSTLYPSAKSTYPDYLSKMLTAAQSTGMKVWLGLGGSVYWNYYLNEDNPAYMAALLAQQEGYATDLNTRYGAAIAGWYLPQEVDDATLTIAAKYTGAAKYAKDATTWLHANVGNKPVMASPFYGGGRLNAADFGQRLSWVYASSSIDAIHVQDGGGSTYTPALIASYFAAIRANLPASVKLFTNADMWDNANGGGPMSIAKLTGNLKAAAPYVTGFNGFSFTSQMGPNDIGTATQYNAYKTYLGK